MSVESKVDEHVDEGSTVTDFLPAERARGITIQSAAISFAWPPTETSQPLPGSHHITPHNLNLIDTPGHADFTFEVLRSLRVLDGAVCILDGVAGVEAQTEKVWAQASAYRIPRIVFVNKLDRDGAAFGKTVKEVGLRLHAWPAVCNLPWWNAEGKLIGVGDVVGLQGMRYVEGGDGKQIDLVPLQELESQDAALAAELRKARTALVELLSEHDDEMVEKYLEADEDHLAISAADLTASLRRCTLHHPQMVVPVFAGASFRNVGVQPLLDSVIDLLPSPTERPDPEVSLGSSGTKGGLSAFLSGKLTAAAAPERSKTSSKAVSKDKATLALQNLEACALAFKVVADARRGVLVYVRVYSGAITRNAPLWNTILQSTERAQRLLKMYANDAVDIESIPAGQIGVIPGLKFARTGDTLVSYTGAHPKNGPPAPINTLQLRPIAVPPPVFFVSVEPNSLTEEKPIKEALALLLREDPSLHVSVDEESGQTHLAGMGELHLEIARDRLITDLKAKARIGSIEIGYRETLTNPTPTPQTSLFDREISGKSSKAACTASVSPLLSSQDGGETALHPKNLHTHIFPLPDNNRLIISTPTLDPDGSPLDPDHHASLPDHLPLPTLLHAFQTGVLAAFARGTAFGYPVHSVEVRLDFLPEEHLFPTSSPAACSSAARLAVQAAMRDAAHEGGAVMMEPLMLVRIAVDEESLGAVVHDLSSARGGAVVALGSNSSPEEEGEEEEESGVGSAEQEEEERFAVDVARIYAPPDPFAGGHEISSSGGARGVAGGDEAGTKQILARVPLKEMVGYLKHLRSLTAGRGTFTMVVDRFERMSGQRQRGVLSEMRGDYF
ncbi:Ribosome-releasing factor 2 [Hortaea werneckii]|nr:Ribosome-releasing factor 2 [Hortaea werneckii]KAI7092840.1 Ribosome-releasing factor 2 [Hortaea werneckii]KAI7231200.1 Ribosome-releasing factor 2 [Hortaea werneckii]KAI7299400.1 Ribosome-releasing factor 2 [Hortaea werneckii]